MSQKYEKAKGSLNRPAVGEEFTARLNLAGVSDAKTKDGRHYDRWWALVRLTTPFKGYVGDTENVDFQPNDLVFANISGVHAIRELEDVLIKHGIEFKRNTWKIPDETQILITYGRKVSQTSGRSYYYLNSKVE